MADDAPVRIERERSPAHEARALPSSTCQSVSDDSDAATATATLEVTTSQTTIGIIRKGIASNQQLSTGS